MSLLELASAARDALLGCGLLVFQHGSAEEIGRFTAGMRHMLELVQKLREPVEPCLANLFPDM